MEQPCYDRRLSLEAQLKLRQVELEAAHLDADELRECLLAAWSGWMLERQMINTALETIDVQIDTRIRGYTPAEVCG